jgi:hypothetical protein
MTNRKPSLLRLAGLSLALALAACGRSSPDEGNLANLDNQLVGNDVDPALTSAINDQILVDPTLANQSNRNAVRPPETPTQAQYPAEGGAGGDRRGGDDVSTAAARSGAPCAGGEFDNNVAWASRLPAAFPLYPGAKVSEAAGNDKAGCRERVVSFATADPWQRVVDYYAGRARSAGYSVEQQTRGSDHVLGGTSESDGGAYYLVVTPTRAGSDVSLIANNGR